MWLPVVLYLFIYIKNTVCLEILQIKNEPLELTELFLENLRADPSLLDDHEVMDETKKFIDAKIEKFIDLVSQSQNAVFSRTKRSLEDIERNISRYSINITSEKNVPTEYSDDIKIFKHNSTWFAISLEDKKELAIFQYQNGSFRTILKKSFEYTTNLAVISTEEFPLIVIGEKERVTVFQFNSIKKDIKDVQILELENPQHVVMWEQDHRAYLSITDNIDNHSNDSSDQKSQIKIYRWLGRHFDLNQVIDLFNIKKTVPFHIHGSYFLAIVNYRSHKDQLKSFSEIFKFDLHSSLLNPYQRVLTNICTDIKYFTSELHGERHHFLVVVHSTGEDFDETNNNNTKSVVYKYEDQYFIPFQSIFTNAIEWQPIQDHDGHAALLAVTKEGLKGFQYDGWHFFESNIISNDYISLKYEEITAIHSYYFEGEQILVFACDHCKYSTNIFKVKFTYLNSMKELHSEILSWCTNSLKNLESTEETDFVGESLRGDLNEQISWEEDQKLQLSAALTESNEILINIENLIEHSLQSNNDHIFDEGIETENVIFNDKVEFKSLQTDSFNNFNVNSLIDNVLDITVGFDLNNLPAFDVIVSDKPLSPKIINNVPLKNYILVNDDMKLNNLVVGGVITFEDGITIEEKLNNLIVNQQNTLLKEGDQDFLNDLTIDDITVHNLTSFNHHFDSLQEKQLNININNTTVHNLTVKVWSPQEISHVKSLKVKNLDIGGLLNGVSVPVLEQQALKKSGDQILQKTFYFDSLDVEKLNIGGGISGKKIPDDFVMVNKGEHVVNQDVHFSKGIKVNKLEVLHSLNNITVNNDGELDILLTNSPNTQTIPVKKSFDSLIITNPIKLRNKIENSQMDRINPVKIDSESYELDGDVTIDGLGEVRRWLRVEDLKGEDEQRSFRVLLEKGLKVTDTQIPIHLRFTQPLDLDDTIADYVNFLNPHDWLLQTSDSPQIVTGQKTFVGDLHLEGSVNTFRLNDVDVHKLQKMVLRVEGDQEFEGLLKVNKIIANQGITSNNTLFGENPWNTDSHANRHEVVEEFSIINGNLKVNITRAKNLNIKGLANSLNISETVRDIVRQDAEYKVFGKKQFRELRVDDLIIRDEKFDLLRLFKDVFNEEVILNKNIDLNNEINIENINFDHNLNNVTKENFANMINTKSVNDNMTTVSSDREYDQITVFGNVFINDNFINGKNLSSIETDTVKTDEDYEFENVRFGEAIFVENSLRLEGNIENLDLSNIVEQNSETQIEIEDKTFGGNVFVNGTLNIESTLNGFDIKKFCKFSQRNGDSKILKIEGDVIFVKGPKILNINGLSVKELMENLWFSDKEANISGTIRLQNTTFLSSIGVKEFIDENNLKLLSQNYFSKSKNQEIPAGFSFDDVTFVTISTPKLTTKGTINGFILDNLLKTVLLDNVTQVFESPVYFEEIHVQDLDEATTYSVNDLNLKTDVMLYDAVNTVTGRKIVNNLNVETIKVNHNIKVQEVDILKWLSNAVLTNGTFSVTEKKVLKSATFKQGLSLRGDLNGQEFNENTVMLVDTPQNITGEKNIISNDEDTTKFKILRVKGLVNDIDLENLVQNQFNNANNVLNSEIVFNNSVVVKNINIGVIYGYVNVSELLQNITKVGAFQHFQEKYDNLLDMSLTIENSVKDRAFFFKYFKEIMYLENVYDVFGLTCKDKVFRLLTFSFENGTNVFRTFEWNLYKKEFVYAGENIESYSIPNFMEQISIGDNDYIYIEHPVNHYEGNTYNLRYVGQLLQLINSTTFEPVNKFEKNATKSLISFKLPGLNHPCLGFIDQEMKGMRILCDETGEYYLFQTINMENLYRATTVHTLDRLYLFLAREGLPFKEPSIVVLESSTGSTEFKENQIIFEGSDLNGMSATVIGNVPQVAFSFGPKETTINSGRISIRKLDLATQQFVQWQHIPLTAPLEAHFISGGSFEPLLLVPSADAGAPLQSLRYDGSAGFKKSLKGAALPPRSRIRVIHGGKFLVALQDDRSTGVILGAVIKGRIQN